MAMTMRFVYIYEYGTAYPNGDCFVGNAKFEPIKHQSLRRFTSPTPQGSALTRFFRVVAVLGWPSSTGDAFAVVSCCLIYSDVTYAEMVTIPVCGSCKHVEFRFKYALLSCDCTRQDCDHQLLHLAVGHCRHYDYFICEARHYRSLCRQLYRVRMYDLFGIVEFRSVGFYGESV